MQRANFLPAHVNSIRLHKQTTVADWLLELMVSSAPKQFAQQVDRKDTKAQVILIYR